MRPESLFVPLAAVFLVTLRVIVFHSLWFDLKSAALSAKDGGGAKSGESGVEAAPFLRSLVGGGV